jgi:hypothetical protein
VTVTYIRAAVVYYIWVRLDGNKMCNPQAAQPGPEPPALSPIGTSVSRNILSILTASRYRKQANRIIHNFVQYLSHKSDPKIWWFLWGDYVNIGKNSN